MAGGRPRRLSCCCCCTHSELLVHLLLLWGCLHDVDASSCGRQNIHKHVGDTVEFSPDQPTHGVSTAKWKFNYTIVADIDNSVKQSPKFKGRLKLNPQNFSLTVRELTLQDSGCFKFVSEAGTTQRETFFIWLQVHEPLTPPVLRVNSTFHPSNESCTVLLECISTSNVTYTWTAPNQTRSGSKQQFTVRRQDGDTRFTCSIRVRGRESERSASEAVKCDGKDTSGHKYDAMWLVGGAAAGGALLVGLGAVVGVCLCKRRPAVTPGTPEELTMYAEVAGAREGSSMKCSVYETVDPDHARESGPYTVYDKIQLGRMGGGTVSLYQDIQDTQDI